MTEWSFDISLNLGWKYALDVKFSSTQVANSKIFFRVWVPLQHGKDPENNDIKTSSYENLYA